MKYLRPQQQTSMRRLVAGLAAVALGLAACPPPPCDALSGTPSIRVVHPQDGAIFPGATELRVEWEVTCVAYPCASYVLFWDVTSGGAEDPPVRVDGASFALLHNLEHGTYALRLTLHDSATDALLHEAVATYEVVPEALPHVDPRFVAMTAADSEVEVPARQQSDAPLRVMFVGDTAVFDGMKSFFLDYMSAFMALGEEVAYLDPTCHYMNTDTDGAVFPPPPQGSLTSPVAKAVVATGARFLRWCLMCPSELCTHADTFEWFTGENGPLARARTWADVPPEWRAFARGIGDLMGTFDVVVMAWVEDKPQGRALFLAQLARLTNPGVVRFVDLGPGYTRVPPDIWTADAFMVPSHFVRSRATVEATGVDTHVLHPLIDTTTYSPPAQRDEQYCLQRWGKPPGSVLIGYVARLTSTKSPGLFVRAAAEVLKRLPNARFIMVGKPRHEAFLRQMQRLVAQYNLQGVLQLAGFLPREDIVGAYSCMDVMLCTSATKYETFGIVNAEAMAMGIPIVHFGFGGLQDYVLDGHHSVLAEAWSPEAVAAAVVQAVAQRDAMGRRAREFVLKHLGASVVAPRVDALFRRLSLEARAAAAATATLTADAGANSTLHLQYRLAVGDRQPLNEAAVLSRHARSEACFEILPAGDAEGLAVARAAVSHGLNCGPLRAVLGGVVQLPVPTGRHFVVAFVRRPEALHRHLEAFVEVIVG